MTPGDLSGRNVKKCEKRRSVKKCGKRRSVNKQEAWDPTSETWRPTGLRWLKGDRGDTGPVTDMRAKRRKKVRKAGQSVHGYSAR